MIAVNTRPRTASGAPRWTRSELHTIAVAFPIPPIRTQKSATQTVGETPAARSPTPISPSAAA